MNNFIEQKRDLFAMSSDWTLAHCVGTDFVMGAGIAIEFRKRYGNIDWLLKNNKGIGTSLLLNKKDSNFDRNIFYLITKRRSKYDKPTYDAIEHSIQDMFIQAVNENITMIAMPKIGCGLDGKKWETVRDLIKKYQPPTITITICHL